ncbi:MAG: putative selenate reductase subunit YgfK [Thermoanaerobaculales bacterium]|jgi:putative selenate reductase|nr:putative selenate reductase subunit YgfK [Thermoanaerobaculales bacterium]
MNDHFRPPGAAALASWIARELDHSRSIFGIPEALWFRPSPDDRFATTLHGRDIATPIGVAAGPHTQLAQNIVAAWLCGARVIELKTVQHLDEIEVAKPCIDMQDEGTNIEWSQELTIPQSYREYLTAHLLIHALHARLGFPGDAPKVLFDTSVGYDMDGLGSAKMQWFLEHVGDAGDELEPCRSAVATAFPEIADLEISPRLSDCVTVSTLHGCPPDEIGAIAEHLMDEWGLYTAVKLNPTLVGYETVCEILVEELGWTHIEPHRPAFDADIGFGEAEELVARLTAFAGAHGVDFGIKLCNTLPVINRRSSLEGDEAAAYLSGRPLHALAVELARRFATTRGGPPAISFAGGADAFSTPRLLAAGLRPVTVCSDILRPGGYLRLTQYLDEINAALDRSGARDLDALTLWEANGAAATVHDAARVNLDRYADELRRHPELRADGYRRNNTKTSRPLGYFDCIAAPCTDTCGVHQGVPEYMRSVAGNDLEAAARVISRDNPLPSILGRACHHPCEEVCTRTHLDRPLAIREIKRFVTDNQAPPRPALPTRHGPSVAVVGAGPCGLAAATDLARAGLPTTVFEARGEGGGMVSATIPGYRASDAVVHRDLKAVSGLGVEIVYGVRVGDDPSLSDLFRRGFRHVVVGAGAQRGLRLGVDGEDSAGVLDGLDFLRSARRDEPPELGRRVAVIGGGDVAMDCARSARRITGGEVTLVYRRTAAEMPAHPDEVRDLLDEGCRVRELTAPRRVLAEKGRARALECAVMTLGEPDASGRPRPVEIPGETVILEIDSIIVAIGQRPDLSVFGTTDVETDRRGFVAVDPETLESSVPQLWVGGDLRIPGPSNIVDACGDGRRIAREILRREAIEGTALEPRPAVCVIDRGDALRRRSRRLPRVEIPHLEVQDRGGFIEVIGTLDADAAAAEASRCLDCDLVCGTCESVCPNRAIVSYRLPDSLRVESDGAFLGVEQADQVAVISDVCNHCGNCATFCPTAGRPWHDKPRFFFHRGDFDAEAENAFMLLSIKGAAAIQGRFGGELCQLVDGGELVFSSPEGVVRPDLPSLQPLDGESRRRCAIMLTLLRGVTGSLPYFPVVDAEAGWVVT